MLLNYSTTAAVGTATAAAGDVTWSNPNNIKVDDTANASFYFLSAGQSAGTLGMSNFDFSEIPDFAIIDGVELNLWGGVNTGCTGGVTGWEYKPISTLDQVLGSPTDLWGEASLSIVDVQNMSFGLDMQDILSGDGYAALQYVTATVYWHIDIDTVSTDVATRVDYKVYANDGTYLGLMPNVTSELGFSQDIQSTGSTMQLSSAQDLRDITETDLLQTEAGTDLLTENDYEIFTESTELFVTTGESDDYALYKNANRIEAWLYNYWHPNGKRMFKGQVNKITYSYGGNGDAVNLLVYSDGFDLANYTARGFPAIYTIDISQAVQNTFATVNYSYGQTRFGQTWVSGNIDSLGAIDLKLKGAATAIVTVYEKPPGGENKILGTVSKTFNAATPTDIKFEFSWLIPILPNTSYFFSVAATYGGSFEIYYSDTDVYANGSRYLSVSNYITPKGRYSATNGDLYFKTYSGELSTTAIFTSDDPVTEIASSVIADYNDRGGYITEHDFEATGLSVSYTWVMATVYDVLSKIIELSPAGWYYYIDLGDAFIDIKQVSATPDFTIVMGRDVHQLDVSLSIENVANSLLFTGGSTGGANLYKSYLDQSSVQRYGIRAAVKADNRVTLPATADAIGETFIAENSREIQETKITILNKTVDITKLIPGKTVGFVNSGNMIDDLVLQIVRRDYTPEATTLTLGRLPVSLSSAVQSLSKGLLNEQTINNPASPS